jgi:putative ABC transport system ATP-binding protein
MTPLIELRELKKTYQRGAIGTPALRGIDLAIAEGEYVVLTGPSGCGKSTLLSIIGLLDEPTSGDLLISGHATRMIDDAERARIRGLHFGFVYQSFHLIPHLTIADNVALPLHYHRSMTRSERRERVLNVLEQVGLQDRAEHYPDQVSGGQQQRAAVARALVGKPDLILADEPTGNLDSANSELIMQLLSNAHRQGSAICLVTHDPRYAEAGDRTVTLQDGVIIKETRHAIE